MSQIQVQLGTTARSTFETLNRANGTRTAPDSAPTVLAVHVNGVINSTLTSAASITQLQDATPANITGYYEVTFDTTGLSINDDIDVTVQATIDSFTATKILRFVTISTESTTPVIR